MFAKKDKNLLPIDIGHSYILLMPNILFSNNLHWKYTVARIIDRGGNLL